MKILQIISLIVLSLIPIHALDNGPIPEIIGNNFGKQFIVSLPPNQNNTLNDPIHFIFISPFDTQIIVEIPGKGFRDTLSVKPYQNFVYSLPDYLVQVGSGSNTISGMDNILYQNAAISFSSNLDFSLNVLSDFESTSDGTLIIPVKNLGTEYRVSNYYQSNTNSQSFFGTPSNIAIIATEDETYVDLTIGGEEGYQPNPTVNPMSGLELNQTMNKGDVWVLTSSFIGVDLSGSHINSNKKINVLSSNQCAEVPVNNGFCDFILNSETPVNKWGSQYILGNFLPHSTSPIIRVYANEQNSIIYLDGSAIDTLNSDKTFLNESYIELSNLPSDPFVISSNQNINVIAYNRGAGESTDSIDPGGPFMTSVPNINNLSEEILFSTPNFSGDISYNINHLNLVANIKNSIEIPNELEIGLIRDGIISWEPLNETNYIIEANLISIDSNNYAFISLKLPYPGFFKIRNPEGLNALLYGSNGIKSYAYPASLPLVTTSGSDNDPPIIEWEMLCDGTIEGRVIDESPITNTLFDKNASVNYFFSDFEIDPNHDSPREFRIDIADSEKNGNVRIHFWDSYRNKATLEANYFAPKFEAEPNLIELYGLKPGVTASKTITLRNLSDTDTLIVESLKSGFPDEIQIKSIDGSIPLMISIPPSDIIDLIAEITLKEDQFIDDFIYGNNLCFDKKILRIIAKAESPEISVSDVDMGNIVIGKTYVFDANIRNMGGTELEVFSYTNSNNPEISIGSFPILIENASLTVLPSQEFNFNINITPRNLGAIRDSIVFFSDASTIDSVCYISGNVIEPGLVTGNYNFGRKKVLDGTYFTLPYKLPENKRFTISNEGNEEIRIENLFIDGPNKESFYFEEFEVIVLNPGEEKEIELYFAPETIGDHQAEVSFIINGSESIIKSQLSAFATQPKAIVSSIDLGKRVLFENEIIETSITINNSDFKEWAYSDRINFFEILYDEELFDENGITVSRPVFNGLNESSEIQIPISWEPKESGIYEFEISYRGDFTTEPEKSFIRAEFIESRIEISLIDNDLQACLGQSDTSFINLSNYSSQPVELEGIEILIDQNASNFIIGDNKYIDNFIIIPLSNQRIPVIFTSSGQDSNCDIFIKQRNRLTADTVSLYGKNMQLDSRVEIIPLEQVLVANQIAEQNIEINSEDFLKEADIEEISVTVEYNRAFLKLDENSLIEGDDIQGSFIITNEEFNDEAGYFKFKLQNINNEVLDNTGSIAKYNFKTFVPFENVYSSDVIVTIESNTNKCIDFRMEDPGKISISDHCDISFRKFVGKTYSNQLNEIYPNPVDLTSSISFSIANDIYTSVVIMNSNGELVYEAANGKLLQGEYSFEIPYNDLSSGVYYCIMKAGNYSDTKAFIIQK